MLQRKLWRSLVAVLTLGAFLLQGTWALAGTTGGLSGTVTDETGKPVAQARVRMVSPSQSATVTTDARGHFQFLSLQPDTYSVIVEETGYQPVSISGITIIADQQQTLPITQPHALQAIGRTTSRSATDVVKPGLSADTYAVNATQAAAAGSLGGGGSLNSAYSSIALVPGLTVPLGQAGWNQAVYIRGAKSYDTGYEYDGIPVNRAFDNYDSNTASNLGQQQLQVYTGGGPASISSSTVGGFINQVIKTGTYPPTNQINLGMGSTTLYNQLGAELGGATSNRNFTYYLGASDYTQDFRYYNQFNAGGLSTNPNSPYATLGPNPSPLLPDGTLGNYAQQGIFGLCDANGATTANAAAPGMSPECYVPWNGALANLASTITDREDVLNLHFAVPQKNGLRDDVQALGSISALRTTFYSSPNDLGPGIANYTLLNTGSPYDPASNYPHYVDSQPFNVPFGTPVAGLTPITYYQPSSPTGRALNAPLPADGRDSVNNDDGIVKLQYTHNLSDRAYVRVMGYTFYSDWLQAGADSSWQNYLNFGYGTGQVAANYDLMTHTAGAELQFADQVNDQNLLQFTGNFTRANVIRFNNTGFIGGTSPTGLVADNNGVYSCYSYTTMNAVPCYSSQYKGNSLNPYHGTSGVVSGAAAAAGAQWISLWNGDTSGTYNNVGPRFTSLSLTDEFKPTPKLTIDAGLRYDGFTYMLPNTANPASSFYTQIVQQYECYNPSTLQVYVSPISPTTPPPPSVVYGSTCPTGFVHPNGTDPGSQLFTNVSPKSYSLNYLEPRFSFAYAQNADTVWRASIGRFVQPPISASVQYDNIAGNEATALLGNLVNLGFFTPFHPIPGESATNADASLEHHFAGTDISAKVSPYYRFTNGWQQQAFIGLNFVTQVPVANSRDYGIEFSLQKGDFNRNGFSGMLSYTYTDSRIQFQDFFGAGSNEIDKVNAAISDYNALTASSPCYTPAGSGSFGTPTACGPGMIRNPYYGQKAQPLFNPSGWYVPFSTGLSTGNVNDIGNFTYPHVVTAIVNYRHNKFAFTPSFQFQTGSAYGSPLAVGGVDPRNCAANQQMSGITTPGTDPLYPNYTTCQGAITSYGYLYTPDPVTGNFDNIGAYQNPSVFTINAMVSYDITPRVKLNLTLADVFHTCFGGSKVPWSYTQGCYYTANAYYPSNFYNGAGPNDVAANGAVTPSPYSNPYYAAGTFGNMPFPFNAYLTLSVKL